MAKKYFWLRLHSDFFKRPDIRIVESMPNGKDYVLFYLKLLVESLEFSGRLRFSDTIPYTPDMLAAVTNTNVDVIRAAIKIFEELKMIDIFDDQTLYMLEIEKLTGSETEWASKKRDYRKKLDQREDNVLELSGQNMDLSDKNNNNKQEQEIDTKTNNNNVDAVTSLLKNFGVVGKGVDEIARLIAPDEIGRLINYARQNNLKPGWLLAAARDPRKRPFIPAPGSEAEAVSVASDLEREKIAREAKEAQKIAAQKLADEEREHQNQEISDPTLLAFLAKVSQKMRPA